MEVSGITLELTAGRAYAGGKEVFLTPKEFALLRCLMQNKNLVMSREQLLVKCWGYDLSLIHISSAWSSPSRKLSQITGAGASEL